MFLDLSGARARLINAFDVSGLSFRASKKGYPLGFLKRMREKI